MIKHCAWCGRAFEKESNFCSKECREDYKNSKKPLCPYFSHERYGKRGAIYCEGGVIRLKLRPRKKYIKNNCSKYDGGECTVRKQLEDEDI